MNLSKVIDLSEKFDIDLTYGYDPFYNDGGRLYMVSDHLVNDEIDLELLFKQNRGKKIYVKLDENDSVIRKLPQGNLNTIRFCEIKNND